MMMTKFTKTDILSIILRHISFFLLNLVNLENINCSAQTVDQRKLMTFRDK